MNGFNELLNELREISKSEREKGGRFEQLMVQYFKTDPLYKDKFNNVWLWNDFPLRENKPDTGIDLVAQEKENGEYCAIQCKFYGEGHRIQKGDIDSFFTASGKNIYSSRIIVSTTDEWSKNAEEALEDQSKPITRIRLADLAKSPIDWSKFSFSNLENMKLKPKKVLRKHQCEALENVMRGFEKADRGQMVMACGTGKTFTSLKIAEEFVKGNEEKPTKILYLVPSISLLSQTLREWNNDSEISFNTFAVCSDKKVTKNSEDINSHDLGFPSTTKPEILVQQMNSVDNDKEMSVVFSTYQSIEVISEAQKIGLGEFDLIIGDEAHRTTGVTLAGDNESHFIRIHDQNFIRGKKRLYQTATPKIFAEETKTKADEHNALLCSMDNREIFGEEFHYLGFGEAVNRGLLTDYKVMVLAVDETYIHSAFQTELANENNELTLNDVVKISGCWNGLSKKEANSRKTFGPPMKRAVAFTKSIKDSKLIADMFENLVDEFIQLDDSDSSLRCEVEHVDGTFNALDRNKKLDWLKEETGKENLCRILSNARCLTEGVDVPDLDAVMFLNPRNSVVDVVQAVGRVMRKAEGKDYGYIILPIGIPSNMSPNEALNDNKKYKVVWQVLQALRAHDERFNTMVNQIELNKNKSSKVDVIGVTGDDNERKTGESENTSQLSFAFPNLEELRDAVYGKLVQKVGDKRYWESWSTDVAEIAQRHFERISLLLEDKSSEHYKVFQEFLKDLKNNLNDRIDENKAIEMLSQHMITKPVFDSLFDEYSFVKNNPVSISMEKMVALLEEQSLDKETSSLEKFYESVRSRAQGIDNAKGKQKIIIELYDKFFRSAFKETTDRLGIVYTPVEIVDFIISSANEALKEEFGLTISDEGVHVLDPFTGTGTFIVRLLQSGLIKPEDMLRKYTQELHANEIILLAYYIAAINIEETFHEISNEDYQPFEGIVLTDTFQMTEGKKSFESEMFPENNSRVNKQNKSGIQVIIGNPPYSIGQSSANDNNQNSNYPSLEQSIAETYVKFSKTKNVRGLYDSYIKAFRWASNRIGSKGIICFVTNGGFLDSNGMDGMRESLANEFSSIYCFNLRGNQRTSGELSKKEGGKVFGSGSRTPVAITLLIKNPEKQSTGNINYYDIGDYLTRDEKLNIISSFDNYKNIKWEKITPNKNNDWINQRNPKFGNYMSIGEKIKNSYEGIFKIASYGITTSRDAWTYDFSFENLQEKIGRTITFYNGQVNSLSKFRQENNEILKNDYEEIINYDKKEISWSRGLKGKLSKEEEAVFSEEKILQSMYRPYTKQWIYMDRHFNEYLYQIPRIFPNKQVENKLIVVTGVGANKEFSTLITDSIPDFQTLSNAQVYPMYYFEQRKENLSNNINQIGFFDEDSPTSVKYNAIDEKLVNLFKSKVKHELTAEDIFYYIYAILHSKEYRKMYAADLKKSLPRIPIVKDFWGFSKAGRELANIHLNYETVEPFDVTEVIQGEIGRVDFRVRKMVFGKNKDKSTIIYNNSIKLTDIPLEAYDYQVNGKSAIEWIMDQYQVKVDKASQIIKDPNDWSEDPRYIINLLKRIIKVSIETNKIVNNLPKIEER
ncbi:Adenine specific DNA methyltransferase, putative [Priestia megaterium WSH-002]|uniref:Adenine specific DNA methyltransferase, putative n=1 Tax=Priestia megaterium (strain WSH-002) TaxID=1006007 RepID=A0A8D3X3Y2_PRIMW|nr:type ISP restriction/modification enzyme [Priestia megaterium]AEN91936.1 Adenine specific DNA methyltransferase, putative [Priestia megaterium WSH-002]